MKKLAWTALVAIVSAAVTTLTMRALAYAWRRALHEDPPERPTWAEWLVGKPLHAGVKSVVQ
jgi:hypothetical protein